MNDETMNTAIKRFLKKVGIQSQQAIEGAIREAMNNGKLKGDEHFNAVMQLNIEDLDLSLEIQGDIALEK
jgi:hypothetical protein